jgi:hypothetical protein
MPSLKDVSLSRYEAQWASASAKARKAEHLTLWTLLNQQPVTQAATTSGPCSETAIVATEPAPLLLSEALGLYLSQHPRGADKRFKQNAQLSITYVIEAVGDLPLDRYTKQNALAVRDALLAGLNTLLRELLANAFGDLPVKFQIDVSDAPDLSVDQMTALALLVNEAALNASMHVFSKGLGTRFDVSLSQDARGLCHLVVRDDGPGFTTETVDAQSRSMGLIIMESFAKQLGGSLVVGREGGASLNVEFDSLSPTAS